MSATLVTASLGAISTSQNLAAEAWSGVDVVNVSATRQNLRAIAKNPSEMAAYLSADSVLGRQPVLHGLVMQCATNATRHLEILENDNRFFSHAGTYAAVHCRARVMSQGHLVLAAVITTALFDARWVNPVWELLGLDTSTESAAILSSVEGIVSSFGPVDQRQLDVSDRAFPEASWVPRQGRAWAALATGIKVGTFVCSGLVQHSWIGQSILVGSFLWMFWALHPTSVPPSDALPEFGGQFDDAETASTIASEATSPRSWLHLSSVAPSLAGSDPELPIARSIATPRTSEGGQSN